MSKISSITQELANMFPEWSKIRTDEQSVGFQVLNSMANSMDKMSNALVKMEHNNHLSTVNLHEPTELYKVYLNNFPFQKKYEGGIHTGYIAPTVTANSGTITIKNTEDGKFSSFWNKTLPDRITIGSYSELIPITIENQNVEAFTTTQSYPIMHHLKEGGSFHFFLNAKKPYLRQEGQRLKRARVRIEGLTSKGTSESEVLVFPWASLLKTKKNWKYLTSIQILEDNGREQGANTLSVYSDSVGREDYVSLSNIRVSPSDKKIDEFWGLLSFNGDSYLERVEYITDDFFRLITESSEKVTKNRWLLKDQAGNALAAKDIEQIPFQDKFWAVTDNKLLLYNLFFENYENLDSVRAADKEAQITIKFENPDIITGELLDFKVWHERQLKEIVKINMYCKRPDGLTEPMTDGFIDYSGTNQLVFSKKFQINQEGEYIFYAVVEYEDGETDTDCRVFKNRVKSPLKEFTLLGIGAGETMEGLYYDCNQRLLLKTSNAGSFFYYEVTDYKDAMLIDYEKGIIYFHEKYSEVTVQ